MKPVGRSEPGPSAEPATAHEGEEGDGDGSSCPAPFAQPTPSPHAFGEPSRGTKAAVVGLEGGPAGASRARRKSEASAARDGSKVPLAPGGGGSPAPGCAGALARAEPFSLSTGCGTSVPGAPVVSCTTGPEILYSFRPDLGTT